MQNSLEDEKREAAELSASAGHVAVAGERVITEPFDDSGIILIETRIAPDGSTRTRKITRKGWPVLSVEDCLKINSKYPPEPDCWA